MTFDFSHLLHKGLEWLHLEPRSYLANYFTELERKIANLEQDVEYLKEKVYGPQAEVPPAEAPQPAVAVAGTGSAQGAEGDQDQAPTAQG